MSLRILIVDEDKASRDALKAMLTALGHQVVGEVTSCSDAAGLYGSRPSKPEIALIDVDIPFLDALQVISQVRKVHPSAPVVVMSATSTPAEEIRGVGAVGVIRKPCTPETLQKILNQFLSSRQPTRVFAKPRKFNP
jgi:CheY-like chemotaxis protein